MDFDLVSALISAAAVLVAAFIGGQYSRHARAERAELAEARHTIQWLTRQCESLYELEKLYISEVIAQRDDGSSPEGIKRYMRQMIVDDEHLMRIQVNPSSIDRIRKEFRLNG